MSRNLVLAFNVLVVLGLIAFSIVVYADLPAQIPSHINFEGKADSFVDKGFLFWMLIPILATFFMIVFAGICKFIDKSPRWVNVPHKKLYMELTEVTRTSINQYFKVFMLILGFMLNIILFEVQLMLYQAAMSSDNKVDTLNVYLLSFFALVFVVYMILYLFKFSSMIKMAWQIENRPNN